MAIDYTLKAYIDLDNDGDFSEAEEDISAYLIEASGERGRSAVNDEYAPSSATILLNNASGDLSLGNSSSVYYKKITPRRAVKIEVVYSATIYPIFFGFVNEVEEDRAVKELSKLMLDCTGVFDVWRFGEIRTTLQENKRVDELLDYLLDNINMWGAPWPAGMRDLDVAYETLPIFWQYREKPVDSLKTAAKQELDGHLFDGKDGSVVFRNRWWKALQPLYATISPSGDLHSRAFQISARGEDIIDRVEFTRAALSIDDADTVLYELSPVGREIKPGSDPALNTLEGEFDLAGKDVVTPITVGPTDYLDAILGFAPVAYWRMNDGGSVAVDSASDFDGAYVNAPTQVDGPLAGSTDLGVHFNGVDQYVEVPFDAALNPATTFSVVAWARVTGGEGTQRQLVVSVHNGGGADVAGYFLEAFETDTWNAIILDGAGGFSFIQGPLVQLDKWTMIAMTYDNATLRLYVDGIAVGAVGAPAGSYAPNVDTVLRIGAGTPTPVVPFAGDIAQVAFYDVPLDPAMVTALYDAAKAVDYNANSEPDGSGTDKTAQLDVVSFTPLAGGFSILFDCLDSSSVYLQKLQVRGRAVRRGNDTRKIAVDAVVPFGTEQVLQRNFDFNDNVEDIAAMARLKAAVFSEMQFRPPLMITPEDGTQFVLALEMDIGSKVRLVDTSGPQHSDIDDYFTVEQYKWDMAPKRLPRFTVQLFHVDQSHGNLFRVSPDAPDAIISPIAADAAVVFDRIGV